jgi:hypothetical protein
MLECAFKRDFDFNGPSLVRIARTTWKGWRRYHSHPDERIRRRYAFEARQLATQFSAIVWASRRYFKRRRNVAMVRKIGGVLRDLYRSFPLRARLAAFIGGRYVFRKVLREERRLAAGWTYEPPTFVERNFGPIWQRCRFVVPRALSA